MNRKLVFQVINRKVLLSIVVLPIAFFLLIFKSGLFSIQQVDINLQSINCVNEEELKKEINIEGQSIFMVDQKKVRANIIKKYYCIKEVTVNISFPQKVLITAIGRTASMRVVVLKNNPLIDQPLEASSSSASALIDNSFPDTSTGPFLISDETGFIFDEIDNFQLPLVFVLDENLSKGKQLGNEVAKSISSIFSKLKELGFEEALVAKIINDNLILKTKTEITFSLKKDVLRQLASLQLILQKAKIDGKEMKTIDLRFDKPVVTFFSTKK